MVTSFCSHNARTHTHRHTHTHTRVHCFQGVRLPTPLVHMCRSHRTQRHLPREGSTNTGVNGVLTRSLNAHRGLSCVNIGQPSHKPALAPGSLPGRCASRMPPQHGANYSVNVSGLLIHSAAPSSHTHTHTHTHTHLPKHHA